ncbi:MAG: DUF2190 family protein, partial [Acidobacteriota bacterium]|nr:DUF2190 family protein [Acidobacteriota bacterium]
PTGALAANTFVGFDGNTCALNTKALGATDFAFSAGDLADVITKGTAIVKVGAVAVAVGDKLTSDAAGLAIAGGANPINGFALEAGNPGDLIEVSLI